ncbi:MAG: flagellar hook-basal body protein [Oscillospiraceae bacterium]
MIDSFYTGSTGLIQIQKGMDILANNIANIQTVGFKKMESSFSDLVYTNIHKPKENEEQDTNLKLGHGAKLKKADVLHTQGIVNATGRTLDFIIQGDGFFAVEGAEDIKYTRNGNFHISVEDEEKYLVNSDGLYVLDGDGERIVVPEDESEPLNVGVYQFLNNDGLKIEAGTLFNQTEISGEAEYNPEVQVKCGYLENSNVDMSKAMVDMINIQRAFQFNSRMVQTSDEIMQLVNSLRQ